MSESMTRTESDDQLRPLSDRGDQSTPETLKVYQSTERARGLLRFVSHLEQRTSKWP
jgi:hypothetical protein